MGALLTIGLNKNGEIVKIDDAAHGKNCKCFCPECKNPLIAKNGIPKGLAKREHHFAHQKGVLCEASDETELHRLAKEIIYEERSLMLPVSKGGNRPFGLVHFQSVKVEQKDKEYGFRPDAEAILENGEKVLIEFLVSHKVTPKKRKFIVENKLNCIEIDLNYVEIDKEKIRSFLLNENDNREWIEPTEKKGVSKKDNDYYPYPRNPLHVKAIEYIKRLFDEGRLNLYRNGYIYNLREWKYDVCEPSKEYRKFPLDLIMYRSKENEKGKIAISVRGRRRNYDQKIPRGLRVIDIVVRYDSDYNKLIQRETLFNDEPFIIFEGFKKGN